MITDLDKKKSSNIDFEEFLDMMTARMSDKDTREDITKVSRLFDDDGTGKITLKILEGLLRSSVRRWQMKNCKKWLTAQIRMETAP